LVARGRHDETVVIGVDPHDRTHTAVVVDWDEIPLKAGMDRLPASASRCVEAATREFNGRELARPCATFVLQVER
jgi:hypothetical protein